MKDIGTEYLLLDFKIPKESNKYKKYSDFVLKNIDSIISEKINTDKNKIMINTNLKLDLPMENINKIAGPIIEAWVYEIFKDILTDSNNVYRLINVEACKRLNIADIVLQFKIESKEQYGITSNIDVKSTSDDIKDSGKSPNITSFARIRTMYIEDPDYMFVILSLKHKVYAKKNDNTRMTDAIMEIASYNCYDLKYIAENDISCNLALGTGQIQIRDIHYVENVNRNVWQFCQLLDKKFIQSKKGFKEWLKLAQQHEWIK